MRNLRNDASTKAIRYPSSLEEAYTMLDEYVEPKQSNNNSNNNNHSVNAYSNLELGQRDGDVCLTSALCAWTIDPSWILLDTASTITIFKNAAYLQQRRTAQQPTVIHTSGGTLVATQEGYLPFLQR